MRIKRIFTILFLSLLFSFSIYSQQKVGITIEKGVPMLPVATPTPVFHTDKPEIVRLGKYIFSVFKGDLDFSLVFKRVPDDFYSFLRPLDPKKIFFKDWLSINANILVVSEVNALSDEIVEYSMYVYDVRTEKLIFGKTLRGKKRAARLIAHRLADLMMINFGEKPIFTKKIVFISTRDGNPEVYMMDYDGYNKIRLTDNGYIELLPSISPDGELISYTSYRKGTPDLYIQYLSKGEFDLVSTGGTNYGGRWSYDGREFVYSSSKAGYQQIYLANRYGKAVRRLTFTRSSNLSPSFSPNGKEIAFTSDRSGTPQIYIMNRDGTNVRRITFEGSYNDSPEWSPDGENIAFVSRIKYRFDIYVYNIRTQTYMKLTESSMNENPSWSPDGRHIVFSSTKFGKRQIYIMDWNGKRVRQLTTEGENYTPFWQK